MLAQPQTTDSPPPVAPRALRIDDACKALSISRSHVYSLAAKGKLRLVRIGKRTVVPESEINRLLGESVE